MFIVVSRFIQYVAIIYGSPSPGLAGLMANFYIRSISAYLYSLLTILLVIYSMFSLFIIVVHLVQFVLERNMSENPNKRKKRIGPGPSNQTVSRVIDENWQKLLSSNLNINTENPANKTDTYNGVFRNKRRKNTDVTNSVNNLQNLNISLNSYPEHRTDPETTNSRKELNPVSSVEIRNGEFKKLTKFIAMDCEMVGIGYNGRCSMLARVSIVNKYGDCIYDKFVKPQEEVVDYRTGISGIRRENLLMGENFKIVQQEVADLLKGRILVGHGLSHDLSVLFLSHSKKNIRDTSKYKPFRKFTKGAMPSLKRLAKEVLGVDIQDGEHNSVEDAKAVMKIYCSVARTWENSLKENCSYSKKYKETQKD